MSGGLEKGNVMSGRLRFRIMHYTTDYLKKISICTKKGIEKGAEKATKLSEMERGRKTEGAKSL